MKLKRKPSVAKRTASGDEANTRVSSEALPRRTLEAALRVANVIRDTYASKNTTWEEIATGLKVKPNVPANRYPLWSAVAYGIVLKNDKHSYSLAETGRKILAPTYEGERDEGIKKALFTPSVLSRFFTDYNGATLPTGELFSNVLETRYQVPRERTKEAVEIIMENARFAGALSSQGDGKETIRFTDAAFPVSAGSAPLANASVDSSPIEGPQRSHATDWDKVCFIITPIGADDSQERKHADAVLKHLIEPVLEKVGFQAVRADKISKPGIITKQIIEHIAHSRLCIADLSFNNPNAFYEIGVRQAFKLSTIQIIRKGDKIPFDVSQGRTIVIDTSDPYTIMDRVEAGRNELREHVESCLKGSDKPEDNPISLFLPKLRVTIEK